MRVPEALMRQRIQTQTFFKLFDGLARPAYDNTGWPFMAAMLSSLPQGSAARMAFISRFGRATASCRQLGQFFGKRPPRLPDERHPRGITPPLGCDIFAGTMTKNDSRLTPSCATLTQCHPQARERLYQAAC